MKVYGVEITEAQQQAAIKLMMGGHFEAKHIKQALIDAGVPPLGVAVRATDRILQREKKAGRIRWNGLRCKFVGGAA